MYAKLEVDGRAADAYPSVHTAKMEAHAVTQSGKAGTATVRIFNDQHVQLCFIRYGKIKERNPAHEWPNRH